MICEARACGARHTAGRLLWRAPKFRNFPGLKARWTRLRRKSLPSRRRFRGPRLSDLRSVLAQVAEEEKSENDHADQTRPECRAVRFARPRQGKAPAWRLREDGAR